MSREVSIKRSVAKAITYRGIVMTLDFSVLYLMTHTVKVAMAFTTASNLYTTAAYLFHERLWSRIKWGLR